MPPKKPSTLPPFQIGSKAPLIRLDNQKRCIEASSLGLSPGIFPQQLFDPDGKIFSFRRSKGQSALIYVADDGQEIHLIND